MLMLYTISKDSNKYLQTNVQYCNFNPKYVLKLRNERQKYKNTKTSKFTA